MKNKILALIALTVLPVVSNAARKPAAAAEAKLECKFENVQARNPVNLILEGKVDKKNELDVTKLEYDDGSDLMSNYQGAEPVAKNGKNGLKWVTAVPDDDNDYGQIYTLMIPADFRKLGGEVSAKLDVGGWGRDGQEYVRDNLDGICKVK